MPTTRTLLAEIESPEAFTTRLQESCYRLTRQAEEAIGTTPPAPVLAAAG